MSIKILTTIIILTTSILLSVNATAQQDSTIVLQEVNVFGTSGLVSVAGQKASLRQIPQSVSIIKLKQMREFNLTTVDDALQHVAGVTTIVNDNMRSQYKSRGYAMNVMYDGLPSYNSLGISQQLDLSFYEQVEILRGPTALLQGVPNGQTLGGVVNLVKKHAGNEQSINTTVSTGSWNNYRGEIDVSAPLNTSKTLRSRWMVFGNDRNFFYDRSHQTKTGAYGVLEWNATSSTLLSISYSHQNAKSDVLYNGIPAIRQTSDDQSRHILITDRTVNPTPDWDYTRWKTNELFFKAEQKINDRWLATLKINRRGQTQQNKFAVAGTVTASDTTSNYQIGWNDENIPRLAAALDVSGKFNWLNREHSLYAGFNAENYEDARQYINGYSRIKWGHPETLSDFTIPDDDKLQKQKQRITQSGLFGQLRLTVVEPLILVLGGRLSSLSAKMYDYANNKWVDALDDKIRFTPYAGIVYTPIQPLSFYASYSNLYVPQTEKREDGSMLDPRIGTQYELGTKNSFFNSRLGINLAFFYLQDDGRAYRVSPAPAYINGGKVENKGIDIEINGTPLNNVEVIAGYTYLKTKVVKSIDGDEGLAFSPVEPENSLKFWGIYRFDTGMLQGLAAGIGVMAFSSKYASILTPEREQDGYAITNAFVSYVFNSHFLLNLNLNNILDTKYYARVGGNGDYFGEPRNVNLSMRCNF